MKFNALIILAVVIFAFTNIAGASARIGTITALSVAEDGSDNGDIAEMSLEIKPGHGSVFIESNPLTRLDTQMSARLANEAGCRRSTVECSQYDFFYIIKVRSSIIGGPSAGGALAVLTYAVLEDLPIRNDTAMTGSILSGDIIGPVGGVDAKARAAARNGYAVVLIPAWESAQSNLTAMVRSSARPAQPDDLDKYGINYPANQIPKNTTNQGNTSESENITPSRVEERSILVVPITTLDEAIERFTGKKPHRAPPLGPPPIEYSQGMERVAGTLCEHALILRTTVDSADLSELNRDNRSRIKNLTQGADAQYARAQNATARNEYYSAASLCFASSLLSQEANLLASDAPSKLVVLENLRRNANAIREAIEKSELQTISDLEVTMIASERLADVEKVLADINRTNPDPGELAYATERLETARAWFTLLGRIEGKQLELTSENLLASCRLKLDEAQERVNYVSLLYPQAIEQLQETLHNAVGAAQRQQSALCILQSSQAKAEANSIMSALYVPEENYPAVIAAKGDAAREAISAMRERGSFPILSYSYIEYAGELLPRDNATAALYTEYSLELASLPIYFPSERYFIRVDKQGLAVFLVGTGAGVIIGFLGAHFIERAHQKRHRAKPQKRSR